MEKCPNCGAQVKDDSLFCTECGKPIPQGCVCPHCGASINEGDVFCQNCGKSINESPSEEIIINDEEKKSGFKKYLPYIIGAFVLLMVIGYCSSNDSQEGDNTVNVSDNILVDSTSVADELSTDANEAKDALQAILSKTIGVNSMNDADNLRLYYSQEYKNNYNQACKKADSEGNEYPRLWWSFSDSDPEEFSIEELKLNSNNEAKAKVKLISEMYIGEFEVITKRENGKWLIDKVYEINTQENPNFAATEIEEEETNYDWLQGHWVYDVGVSTDRSYRIHVVIEGNRIVQYKNNRSESPNPTFTIEDGKIHAPYYKDMETTYLIDPVRKSIDLGDGWRWMYKLGSDEEIRHRVGFETEYTFFIKIANQSFRNQEGKEIRFDENKKVYFNDVYAGTLSIVKLEKTKAVVNYNGGEFGEGKFDVHTNLMTTNFLMIDKPSDGVFTKIRNTD